MKTIRNKSTIGYYALVAVLFGVMFASCQEDELENASVTNQAISKTAENSFLNIPYTNDEILSKFNQDREIINYSLARKIAMIEADAVGFVEEMNWEGHSLSKQPVVIYGFDSKPKYYEFFYKDAEGKEVGSVTVMAKRKASTVLQEVRGSVRDYNALYSKAASGSTLIADWAGNVYLGIVGKSGEAPSAVIKPETGEAVQGMTELTDEEILNVLIRDLDNIEQDFSPDLDSMEDQALAQELLKTTIKSSVQQKDSMVLEMKIEQKQALEYWTFMEEHADSIALLTDEELAMATKGWFSNFWRKVFGKRKSSKYEISRYRNNLKYRDQPGDWCAPWGLGWMYHTQTRVDKYDEFEAYYSHFLEAIFGGKPLTPRGMWQAAKYEGDGIIYVNSYFSTGRSNAYSFIRNTDQPIFIYDFPDHYKVAYGCYKSRTGIWWTNYYFAVNDNGAKVKNKSKAIYHRASWYAMRFIKAYDSTYRRGSYFFWY